MYVAGSAERKWSVRAERSECTIDPENRIAIPGNIAVDISHHIKIPMVRSSKQIIGTLKFSNLAALADDS